MKRTKLNPISQRQLEKNRAWRRITDELCRETGYVCMWCGFKGQRTVSERLDWLTGHHIVSRARGGIYTKDNCYICHITCHQFIHDNNVDLSVYKNKEEWLERGNANAIDKNRVG